MDKKIFRDISYGMYIVSSKSNDNKNVGCVINTLTQITSTEPTISISLNKDNYTNKIIKEKKQFAVSILSEQTSEKTIGTFGYKSSIDTDKFNNVSFDKINDLNIVTDNICGYLICEVINIVECQTHDLFIAKVIDTKKVTNNKPMTYKYYHEVLKGKSPANAPTYIEENKNNDHSNQSSKYECIICGYIYDDSIEKIKFEDLPEDWKCPRCGVGKDKFRKIS